MQENLLTSKQVCELLNISERNLYRLRKGGMPYYKIGGSIRFNKKELLEWLQTCKTTDK